MARTPLIAGNWKMNPTHGDAVALLSGLRARLAGNSGVDVAVCPPFIYLREARELLAGSSIGLGAQNAFWEDKGAYTGEVSAAQLAGLVDYVIIGHSERRQFFGETDETVNLRLRAALQNGLKPIFCVGETLDHRNSGATAEALQRQVRAGVDGIDLTRDFIVAYEPVWAIGTGVAAGADTAEEAIALIRATLAERCGATAEAIRILYGGSMTPENTAELIAQPNIDGGLIGGASLKVDAFAGIIESAAAVTSPPA